MDISDFIELIDGDLVREIKVYRNGACATYNLAEYGEKPRLMPGPKVVRFWASEDGRGISIVID